MPSLDEIRTVTIQAKTDGVTQSTDQVNKLAGAQDKLADSSNKATVVTDTQTRSHLSAQTALDRLRRQIDTNFASQQNMERGQTTLSRAEQQGLITGAQHLDLLGKLKERYGELTPAETKFAEASAVVESRMVGMSASVGLVGEALAILGPVGLASAAAIGAAAVAAVKFTESANRMGDWARQLQDTSDTIRVTTTDLQGLEAAGERVGVNAESNVAAFEKFAVNLGALKNGTGSLYSELQKVNPSLVDQLSVTKSNAAAWDLLARAYAQADAQQQALIAHAAFGRGGAAEGRVLTATSEAGGLSALADQANGFTQAQIAQWAQLRAEIATASSEASRNIASIFTGPVLEAEAKFASAWLDLSRSLRDFQPGAGWNGFVSGLVSAASHVPFLMPIIAAGQLLGGSGKGAEATATAPSFNSLAGNMFPAGGPLTSAGVDATRMKDLVAQLGPAATSAEHLQAKIAELNFALEEGRVSTENYGRAVAALRLETTIQDESRRNSLLGDLASATDLAKQKQDELNLSIAQGVKFSADEIRQMQVRNELLAESSKLESKLVFDRQQLFKTATDQSVDATLRAAGIPSASDRAAAIRDYARMTDALKQMNDVGGTFASGFLTDISHGVTAVDALHNAVTRLADTLIDMAARQLVASALGGLASSFLGGSVLPGGAALGSGGIGHAHTGGIIGTDSLATSYVHPAYFENAPRFHSGGIAGDEVPIIARKGEGVFTPGQMAALSGSQTINVNMSVDVSGATGDRAIVALVQKSAQAAVKQAVATANAQSPARQLAYHQLGT